MSKQLLSRATSDSLESIRMALDWSAAKIAEKSKGKWTIEFLFEGKTRSLPAMPATQLLAWIDGAISMHQIAQITLSKAVKPALADATDEALLAEIAKRCNGGADDFAEKLGREVGDVIMLDDDQVREHCEHHEIALFDDADEKAIVKESPVFHSAVLIAHGSERDREDAIKALRFQLADMHTFNAGAMHLL